MRKKVKRDKDNSTQQLNTFFYKGNQLLRFKEEFGHCNVPNRYAGNPSLGKWCSEMRKAYKKIQKGMKTNSNLSQDRIKRLEEIGFQWVLIDYDKTFEKRCRKLVAVNEEFGHCNVPCKYAGNPSLGNWRHSMRNAYTKIQKGMKTNLSKGRIEHLEGIGFQWKVNVTFEECCRELIAFKEEFRHCNVPSKYAGNPSLGHWYSGIRTANKNIQKRMKTSYNLSLNRIKRLEEIGFQWQI